jgi:hypothetical protein
VGRESSREDPLAVGGTVSEQPGSRRQRDQPPPGRPAPYPITARAVKRVRLLLADLETSMAVRLLPLLLVPLLLAGCESSDSVTRASASPSSDNSIGGEPAPAESATVDAINMQIPLASAKGYKGSLQIGGPGPSVELGDPGNVKVTGLQLTTVTVTNETEGGRSAYLEGAYGQIFVLINASWRLPPDLKAYAKPAAGCCCASLDVVM